jgi:predicted GIY-YIG superfamily endonuclease
MARTRKIGIYGITCAPTGQVYIGSSRDIARRWWEHRHHLRLGRHYNSKLQAAWAEHGERAFRFVVIAEPASDKLQWAENLFLAAAREAGPTLNISQHAAGAHGRSRRVVKADWSAIAWATKSNKEIARDLGCSEIPVARHRPLEIPSPGASSAFLSQRAKLRLSKLTPEQRLDRGRRLYANRTPEGEARRIAAVRSAKAALRRGG